MYLERLELINAGPIKRASIEAKFSQEGLPKPIILVGKNGSGKSIAIAHVVSALIEAHGTVYDDNDVEKGKVYKLRHPQYIKIGSDYSIGEVFFSEGFSVHEIQLNTAKKDRIGSIPEYSKWEEMNQNESSHFTANFHLRPAEVKKALGRATHIYFPPNRFEDPAWLNEANLLNKTNYSSLKNFSNYSNRPIVNYAPMRELQSWLLDIIYDSYAIERRYTKTIKENGAGLIPVVDVLEVREGPASTILEPISDFIRTLFGKTGIVEWNIGRRNSRQIGVKIGDELVTSNLFQLSTGQSVLLDLFLTIIRDYDLSFYRIAQLSDIEGLVIVDEVDLHLHTDLQHDLLPKLISLFPKVQFILTTHSPLFLIGMEKVFASDGVHLIELPGCHEIEVERFSEFEAAYQHMQESARFQNDVRKKIEESNRPVVYLEGATDIDYISRAAKLLGKEELLNKFVMIDAVGCPHLNKIWDAYKSHLGETVQQRSLLLYDCDTDKPASNSGNLFRRTIPKKEHKISVGIENLFPDSAIAKAISYKAAFVDVVGEHTSIDRGVENVVPESWKVNRDEKRNLCNWICENGDRDDFFSFGEVFNILEEFINFDLPAKEAS